MMKHFLVVILMSMFLVGCASYDIRNWDAEKQTGQIVVYTGEDWLVSPTVKDADDALMESGPCPNGYVIKELGWRGGGWITSAEDTEDKVTTTTSLNVGGNQVSSVERTTGSKSGESTSIKAGGFETAKSADGKGTTIVRSPAETPSSSGGFRGKWFDFKCKAGS